MTFRDEYVAFAPNGRRIAFSVPKRHPDPDAPSFARPTDLYAARTDARRVWRLTNMPGTYEGAAQWAPDGRKIAFGRWFEMEGSMVYVVNPDGTGLRRVRIRATEQGGPRWSPDGRRLVYSASRLGQLSHIYVTELATGRTRRLPRPQLGNQSASAWLPNGAIAVIADIRERPLRYELALVDDSGENRRRVAATSGHWEGAAWSPDASRVALTEFVDSTRSWIVVVSAEGRELFRTRGRYAVWSPDGKKLVFSRGDVWVMNADGSGQKRLTASPRTEIPIAWLPATAR